MELILNQSSKDGKTHIRTCDIIVLTYNNGDQLHKTLQALAQQLIPPDWSARLILCDDAPSPTTQSIVHTIAWPDSWQDPIVLSLVHSGRSGARNAGMRVSDADILLFLADDIVVRQGSLSAHMQFHEQHPDIYDSALGWVVWDPRISPTPLMEWMTHGGQQNDFDALLGEHECAPEQFFYGSHVSVKREMIRGSVFPGEYTSYGWEDLELGRLLQGEGMRLHPLRSAVALHAHWYSASAFLSRQVIIGAQKYRVNTNVARMIRHGIYHYSGVRALCRMFMKIYGNKLNNPRFFQWIIAGEFWYGVHHANRLLIRKYKKVA